MDGMSRIALLGSTMEAAYARLRSGLDGLSDEEFFWEPAPGCWTVRRVAGGRWAYDYAIPDPVPAPVTTIAWQVVHLGTCKLMYHEWAFGPARLTWPELSVPGTPADALALLDRGHGLLRQALHARQDAQLDEEVATNWGERWPAWRIFTVMTDHDALHGGAIGCLRDIYRWTRG
jgi:DinB superfamily